MMNAQKYISRHQVVDQSPEQKVRRPVVYAILAVSFGYLVLAVGCSRRSESESSAAQAPEHHSVTNSVPPEAPVATGEPLLNDNVPAAQDTDAAAANKARTPPPRLPAPILPPPSAASQQMVATLWNLVNAGSVTGENAAVWMQTFEELVRGGTASVPALAQLLNSYQDQYFDAATMATLGYESIRVAAFEALALIGGPEATGVLGDVLQTTASPREIAWLAVMLEDIAPGQYRAQAVEAARESLAMAVEQQLQGFDVAPLFEVLQRYGGTQIVGDLQNSASFWSYYATLTLGKLPDGAGVPSLIALAQVQPDGQSSAARLQALRVLAQLATTYPDARTALLQQVQANQIPPNYWPYLARPLSGDQAQVLDSVFNENLPVLAEASTGTAHIAYNNQNVLYAPAGGQLTAEQVVQQLALVEELAAVTSDPNAQQVLERTRLLLNQRLETALADEALEPDG